MIGTFAYDNLGRRTSLTLGNGVATAYTYDAVSRLNDLQLDLPGTTDDLTSAFTYNPASQIAGNTRSNDAYSWTGHGSGTTSTTSNGRNQIASWVSTLGYDTKGNITSDGTYTYGYSSENLLTSLSNPSGAVQTSSTYAYDPLMRLAVIDSSNSGLDASLGYDGEDFILEGLSSSRTRRYVRGPGVDEPLVAYLVTSTGTSRLWYQTDERGSIVRLSNDSGVGGIGKYDENGVGGTGRIRYAGQYWLGDANLIYSRARIYDARLGRFLQPDPIGYSGGMNMYAYVGGDPINATDPSGNCAEIVWAHGGCDQTGALTKILNALGIDTGGMTSEEVFSTAAQVISIAEGFISDKTPRNTPVTFGLITGSTGTSGSGGQGTSNTPVVLSYITKGGGPSGYDYWLIEWRVAKGMSGWIIQELNTTATFKDGKVVNLPTYWEAFRVSGVGPGSRPQDLFDRVGISLS